MSSPKDCKDYEEGQCRRAQCRPTECFAQCGRMDAKTIYTPVCARCLDHDEYIAGDGIHAWRQAETAGWKFIKDKGEGWVCHSCITAEFLEGSALADPV